MGQYPPPYSLPPSPMPPAGLTPPPDLMAPARRAGIMLFVIAGLALMLGLCAGFVFFGASKEQLREMIAARHLDQNAQGLPPGMALEDLLHLSYMVVAVIGLFLGLVMTLLGFFVRRASKAAVVFAVIICGLLVMLMGLAILSNLLSGGLGNPMAQLGMCMTLLPLALFLTEIKWLMQTLNALPQIQAAHEQWRAYYAASHQQQQIYNQGAAGYGYRAPPAAEYPQPPYGAPPIGGQGPFGYGIPPAAPPVDPNAPATRHPPLPPDQQ